MKVEFKVGDKVRIIDNTARSNNKIGDEGIIVEIVFAGNKRGYKVQVEGRRTFGNWSAQKDIQLVEQETLEEVRNVERTELFNSIFSVVKKIPRKDVDGDAMDAPSCAYEIEQLFYNWQQEQDKQEIQDLKNRLGFVHESSAKAIELVEALQLQTKGTYNEDTIRQALLRLTLVNPVHLEMTSNGHGEFPDGYKLTGKGIDYIVEQLKK